MTRTAAISLAPQALRDALEMAPGIDLGSLEEAVNPRRWTLSGDVLRLLCALVRRTRPRHVMEFGSGVSTRALVQATREFETSISSIDHDPEFGVAAAQQAERERSAGVRLRCQIAPLVCRLFGGDPLPAYLIDRRQLASPEPVDLALIDGPPELLGGRAATLYQVMDYARPGALALLDDADRPSEQAALRQWRQTLGDAVEIFQPSGYEKGLAVIHVRQPVLVGDLWRHRLEAVARDIRAAVPKGERLILLDEQQCERSQLRDYRVCGLMNEEGQEAGSPADDAQALSWLAETRRRGAQFCAVAWPAFWWRSLYPMFWRELERASHRRVDNGRVVVFEFASAECDTSPREAT